MTEHFDRSRKRHKKHSSRRKLRRVLAIFLGLTVVAVCCVVAYALRSGADQPTANVGVVHPQGTGETSVLPTVTTAPTDATEEPTTESTEPDIPDDEALTAAQAALDGMTLEEKIYQMFVVTPDSLAGFEGVSTAGDIMRTALAEMPVGGLILFDSNLYSAEQVRSLTAGMQTLSKTPLLIGVDEEGGRVSRLSRYGLTDQVDPMATFGAAGDAEAVYRLGGTLGAQLKAAGFNVDFAPVADVVTNPNNTEIGDRSFSSDPKTAATMVAAMVDGLQDEGTISCLKHFPGHGSTEADSHEGVSVSNRTLAELRETELLPFEAGIEAGAQMVMISHMSLPNVTGSRVPADLSKAIVTDLLRDELGFDGVIISDSHEMGAITDYYSSGGAAVLAIDAGCDIVLMPADLAAAADAVLKAIESGELTEARIDESVLRILTMKYRAGIIEMP